MKMFYYFQWSGTIPSNHAGHIPNWDLAADQVNLISRSYRSPRSCRVRYEFFHSAVNTGGALQSRDITPIADRILAITSAINIALEKSPVKTNKVKQNSLWFFSSIFDI